MSRLGLRLYTYTAISWGATAIAVPSWWDSPGFDHMLFPLWVYGIVWLVSGIAIGAVLVAEVPVLVVSASLALYSFASIGTGFSVLISTMDVGEVSAVGSSIAWLGYGFAAAGRAHLLIEGVRAVSSGGSE